ncbi:hypothetical protein U1Q18_030914, partial [Sarracenia purpurea var. burkii]
MDWIRKEGFRAIPLKGNLILSNYPVWQRARVNCSDSDSVERRIRKPRNDFQNQTGSFQLGGFFRIRRSVAMDWIRKEGFRAIPLKGNLILSNYPVWQRARVNCSDSDSVEQGLGSQEMTSKTRQDPFNLE